MSLKKSVAIISNSFSGHMLASLLEQENIHVTLISTSQNTSAEAEYKNNFAHRIFNVVATDGTRAALEHLQKYYVDRIVASEYEAAPITYENEAPHPFVGFGDSQSSAISCLTQLNHSKFFEMSPAFLHELSTLNLKTKPYLLSELSDLTFVDSKLEKITINGTQEITADIFIFLTPPSEYLNIIPHEYLGHKTRTRVAKTAAWTRVSLNLEHANIYSVSSNLIFMNSPFADVAPCVGRFYQETTPTGPTYRSIWETYVDKNLSEDPEFLATTLKGIKRLLKKFIPAMASVTKETINICPYDASELSWVLASREFKELANNLIISPTLAHPYLGFAQCVVSVTSALEEYNFLATEHKSAASHTSILEAESSH